MEKLQTQKLLQKKENYGNLGPDQEGVLMTVIYAKLILSILTGGFMGLAAVTVFNPVLTEEELWG